MWPLRNFVTREQMLLFGIPFINLITYTKYLKIFLNISGQIIYAMVIGEVMLCLRRLGLLKMIEIFDNCGQKFHIKAFPRAVQFTFELWGLPQDLSIIGGGGGQNCPPPKPIMGGKYRKFYSGETTKISMFSIAKNIMYCICGHIFSKWCRYVRDVPF